MKYFAGVLEGTEDCGLWNSGSVDHRCSAAVLWAGVDSVLGFIYH